MAKKGDPIEFTVGDQENIAESRILLEGIAGQMSVLPCVQTPPQCTQEVRLNTLETSKKRQITAIIAVLVTVAGGLLLWGLKGLLTASTGIPIP